MTDVDDLIRTELARQHPVPSIDAESVLAAVGDRRGRRRRRRGGLAAVAAAVAVIAATSAVLVAGDGGDDAELATTSADAVPLWPAPPLPDATLTIAQEGSTVAGEAWASAAAAQVDAPTDGAHVLVVVRRGLSDLESIEEMTGLGREDDTISITTEHNDALVSVLGRGLDEATVENVSASVAVGDRLADTTWSVPDGLHQLGRGAAPQPLLGWSASYVSVFEGDGVRVSVETMPGRGDDAPLEVVLLRMAGGALVSTPAGPAVQWRVDDELVVVWRTDEGYWVRLSGRGIDEARLHEIGASLAPVEDATWRASLTDQPE